MPVRLAVEMVRCCTQLANRPCGLISPYGPQLTDFYYKGNKPITTTQDTPLIVFREQLPLG